MQHAQDTGPAWLDHYPPGVDPTLTPSPFRNLGGLVRDAAVRWPDRTAATLVLPNGMEASLSFSEIDRLSDAFAAWLTEGADLQPGDRVAILLPNSLAYPICAFGALKAGGVVVNTNPLYTPRELQHQLQDSGATVLVVLDKFGDKLASVVPETSVRTVVTTSIADFFSAPRRLLIGAKLRLSGEIPKIGVPHQRLVQVLREGALHRARRRLAGSPEPEGPGPDTLALLQYTGGTTGTAKGAMLTHGNLLANVAQIRQITGAYLDHGKETVLTVLPLYHVFAFTINLLFAFHTGAHNVLVPNPRPLKNLRPAFARHEITWSTAVNTLLKGLLAEPWFQAHPPRALRAVYAGGTATQPEVLQGWEALTGGLVIEGYGLSETSPLVTFNPARRDGDRIVRTMAQVGGVGLPLPGTEVRVVDDEGRVLGADQDGEVVVRGPQVMQGYWNQPEETARVLQDGWLRTGDVAHQDAMGYVEITDRKKDLIIVSGFNVYPNEVEACIAQHPDVADVAVVGLPDDATGEAVAAFVVPRDAKVTVEAIREHCRTLLAGYKVPRKVSFLGEMPKNALGKTLRRELRATE